MEDATIVVFYVKAGGGHRAAAEALCEAARAQGYAAEACDALSLTPRWFARAYTDAHAVGAERAPLVYGAAFEASNGPDPVRDRVRAALDHAVGARLVDYVRARRPLAVICTHFFPLVELGRARREGALAAPLVATVTDYVTHAVWGVPGVDLYCTAPGRAADDLRAHGLAGAALLETGVPVRAEFGQAPAWSAPAGGEALRVLVTSGGYGVGPIERILRGFRGRAGIALDVVCGARDEVLARARREVKRSGLDAAVSGFVDDMPSHMARAHVVVGKPGGLTASECLAAGRPLVSVGACPGQERANEVFLAGAGAALPVAARQAGETIAALAASGALGLMAERARAIGIPDAAARVVRAAIAPMARVA